MSCEISAVIITCNDAERIRPCLESIRWVDEVVIMDLGSKDNTAEICREFTERVSCREWLPSADPIRDEVVALAHGPWILMLDPDERVTPELAGALRQIAMRDDLDAVLVPYWHMTFGFRRSDPLDHRRRYLALFQEGRCVLAV